MRYVGIDFGDKKVGFALSNEAGTMAFPECVMKNDATFRAKALTLIREHKAVVVLGDSRANNGTENPIARQIKAFAAFLQGEDVRVFFEPERYTSREAERIQGRTSMSDASAAAILLTSFLTRNNHHTP